MLAERRLGGGDEGDRVAGKNFLDPRAVGFERAPDDADLIEGKPLLHNQPEDLFRGGVDLLARAEAAPGLDANAVDFRLARPVLVGGEKGQQRRVGGDRSRGDQIADPGSAGGHAVHVSFVKALGEGPGPMFRLFVDERKKERRGIRARDRLEDVELDLRQIVKAVVKDALELLEISRGGRLVERHEVQVRVVAEAPVLRPGEKSLEEGEKGLDAIGRFLEEVAARRLQGGGRIDRPVLQVP